MDATEFSDRTGAAANIVLLMKLKCERDLDALAGFRVEAFLDRTEIAPGVVLELLGPLESAGRDAQCRLAELYAAGRHQDPDVPTGTPTTTLLIEHRTQGDLDRRADTFP